MLVNLMILQFTVGLGLLGKLLSASIVRPSFLVVFSIPFEIGCDSGSSGSCIWRSFLRSGVDNFLRSVGLVGMDSSEGIVVDVTLGVVSLWTVAFDSIFGIVFVSGWDWLAGVNSLWREGWPLLPFRYTDSILRKRSGASTPENHSSAVSDGSPLNVSG